MHSDRSAVGPFFQKNSYKVQVYNFHTTSRGHVTLRITLVKYATVRILLVKYVCNCKDPLGQVCDYKDHLGQVCNCKALLFSLLQTF